MEKISKALTLSNEEFLQKAAKTYRALEYTFNEEYVRNDVKMSVTHNLCGYTYSVTPNKFLCERRCPRCSGKGKSKAVNKILAHFDKIGVYYETEFVHEEIKNDQTAMNLPFDFALLTKGLDLVLFEYDGIQHFETTKGNQWTVEEEGLEHRKHLDSIKTKKCKELGIRLIRLNYTHEKTFDAILPRLLNKTEFITRCEFSSLS